jgi:ATP-binding cassette subfamily B protein
MLRLFSILLKRWHIATVIVAFLAFQAYCELELPAITADIINIGIQQSGIETPVPEQIEAGEMEKLLLIVNDPWQEEDILAHYSLSGNVYVLDEHSELLGQLLFHPLAIKLFAENMTVESFAELAQNSQARGSLLGIMGEEALEANIANVKQMLETGEKDYHDPFVRIVLEMVKTQSGEIDPVILQQSAIMQTRSELVAAGVDADAARMNYIYASGGRMVLFTLGAMSMAAAVSFLASAIAAYFARESRRAVFRKVLSFSARESDSFSAASLITRCTNDVQQVQWVLSYSARLLIFAPMMGVGAFFRVAASESGAAMGWVIGLAIGLIFTIVVVLVIVAVPRFNRVQSLIDRLNLISRETLSGLPVIRAFSREEHEMKRFDKANTDLIRVNLFINRTMAAMFPTMMFIMNAVSVLIIWVGAGHVDSGHMQIGDLMAFINYTMQIIMAFLMLSVLFVILPRAVISFNRIAKVLDTEISVTEPTDPVPLPKGETSMEFRNVSFKYHNAEEAALSDISFTARSGETVAIIGSTGSGKSTLAGLIPRFADSTSGEILINGVNIREVPLGELRGRIGYVPQKAVVFSGSISENIAYSDDGMSEPQIKRAAEIAQACGFIAEKADGYGEIISQGGTNLSGGQKQRLSIARAIAKKADIYVFDDCFSALDYKTDAALRKALSEQVSALIIIVAQRISTVMNADKIIVLEEGATAGAGTHSELLKSCETYRQIAQSQLSADELGGGEAV